MNDKVNAEVIIEIAAYHEVQRECVEITHTAGPVIWYKLSSGSEWNCETVRAGKRLKKNSIRRSRY